VKYTDQCRRSRECPASRHRGRPAQHCI